MRRILVVCVSLAASTHMPISPRASPSAEAALLASARSHFEAVTSSTITSPKARVAPAVPDMVIPEYLPSAEPAGSRAIEVFSQRVISPVSVPPSVVRIVFHSTAITPGETREIVVSVACHTSILDTCIGVVFITRLPVPHLFITSSVVRYGTAKFHVDEFSVTFVFVFGASEPDAAVENKG